MDVKNTYDETNGLFFIEDAGHMAAIMSYTFKDDNVFVIEHTEVKPAYEGKGLGRQLVKAAVEFAREKGYKILPLCPYAKSVLLKTQEYHDVLV